MNVEQLIEQVAFVSSYFDSKIVAFTNGNAWYIDTLIHNLLTSAAIHEPALKLAVFCSDDEGYEKCHALGFKHFARVDIPMLHVDDLRENTDSTTQGYTKLSFVKVVLCRLILERGFIPLYLDPDMAFKRSGTVDDLLQYLLRADFVCAGERQYINSNILIARPTIEMRELFSVTEDDVIEVLN